MVHDSRVLSELAASPVLLVECRLEQPREHSPEVQTFVAMPINWNSGEVDHLDGMDTKAGCVVVMSRY